jgi:hypothetical protein
MKLLVRLVLLAVSAVRVVVAARITLELGARLPDELTDAASGLDMVETEELDVAGDVETLGEEFDPVAGLVWLSDREAADELPPHPNATSIQKPMSTKAPILTFTLVSFRNPVAFPLRRRYTSVSTLTFKRML